MEWLKNFLDLSLIKGHQTAEVESARELVRDVSLMWGQEAEVTLVDTIVINRDFGSSECRSFLAVKDKPDGKVIFALTGKKNI